MKNVLIVGVVLVLLWYFFLKPTEVEGPMCPVYDMGDYRRKMMVPTS